MVNEYLKELEASPQVEKNNKMIRGSDLLGRRQRFTTLRLKYCKGVTKHDTLIKNE